MGLIFELILAVFILITVKEIFRSIGNSLKLEYTKYNRTKRPTKMARRMFK
jgi:hypothetical protein